MSFGCLILPISPSPVLSCVIFLSPKSSSVMFTLPRWADSLGKGVQLDHAYAALSAVSPRVGQVHTIAKEYQQAPPVWGALHAAHEAEVPLRTTSRDGVWSSNIALPCSLLSGKGVQLPHHQPSQPVPVETRPTYFSINRTCWPLSPSAD